MQMFHYSIILVLGAFFSCSTTATHRSSSEKDVDIKCVTVKAKEGNFHSISWLAGYYQRINMDEKAKYYYDMVLLSEERSDQDIFDYAVFMHLFYSPDDLHEVIKHYKTAAESGFNVAQRRLGSIFSSKQYYDYDAAIYWYEKSSFQGDSTSMRDLVLLLLESENVRSLREAYIWAFIYATKLKPNSKGMSEMLKIMPDIKSRLPANGVDGIHKEVIVRYSSLGCANSFSRCLLKKSEVINEYRGKLNVKAAIPEGCEN